MAAANSSSNVSCRGDRWNAIGWPTNIAMKASLQECATACDDMTGCTSFESMVVDPISVSCILYGHSDVQASPSPEAYGQQCFKKIPGMLCNHCH